jgi:gluconokinase
MGPSGCGKSTLGRALADALGWRYVEGDTLHPPANIDKMSAGIALNDADRGPFLAAVADALVAGRAEGVVVACSALKRRYRDQLRDRAGALTFVLPLLDHAQLVERLLRRADHFMPLSLLESQLADFEMPAPGEGVLIVDGAATPAAQRAAALKGIASGSA